ncbi:MAG: serine hydrolase [Flavobacteriaceae bacterium]|nr:serine hydrolase [Flavobacteriaceae bacterium]
MKYLILLLFFFSCKVDDKPIVFDKLEVNKVIDKYVENESLAVLHVYLEKLDGTPLYSNSRQDFSYIGDFVDENTWFRIWSMSKIVTILLAMDLIEEGVINMNDDVSDYIPELKNLKIAKGLNGEKLYDSQNPNCPLTFSDENYVMTINDLINHKAGFYYATTSSNCLNELISSKNLASSKNSIEFINKLSQLPLILNPGESSFYGLNTTVLGFVLEKASGKTLRQLLKERIIDPFGIEGLDFVKNDSIKLLPVFSSADKIVRKAKNGELDIFGLDVPVYNNKNELFLGGEGMIATSNGYADFLRILLNKGSLNGRVFLNKSTINEISSPHTQVDSYDGYNGYNLWVTNENYIKDGIGDSNLWTGGGYEGTHFWIDNKRGFVGLIMTQIFDESGLQDKFRNEIRGTIYKEIFKNEK